MKLNQMALAVAPAFPMLASDSLSLSLSATYRVTPSVALRGELFGAPL